MTTPTNTPSKGLLTWLILLTLAALLCSLVAVVFGLLVNMDTKLEMNPRGDPLARQEAVEMRVFTWSSVAFFVLLLAAGVLGGWQARRNQRPRRSLGFSLLAAVPMFLAASAFLFFMLRGSQW